MDRLPCMRVLHLTAMWPTPAQPTSGTFVKNMVDGLSRHGIHNDVMVIPARQSRLSYARVVPAFLKTCADGRYDIVHAQYAHAALIGRLQSRVPTVAHYHGEFYDLKDSVLADIASRLVPFGIAVDYKGFRRIHCRVKALIPIGVDPARFHPRDLSACRTELNWDTRKKYVIFPGDPLIPEKNYPRFKRVFSLIKKSITNAEAVILKGVPYDHVPSYLNAADLLLMTSRFEASPTIIKEALLCNLPIVAADVGDVAYLLRNTPGCAVAPPDDQALAAAAINILDLKMRCDGSRWRSSLSIETTTRKVVAFYGEVLARMDRHR